MRVLNEVEKAIVRCVMSTTPLTREYIELSCGETERFDDGWIFLRNTSVVVRDSYGYYTTTWTAEDIARGYRDAG